MSSNPNHSLTETVQKTSLWASAYHEAGHIVAARMLNLPFGYASIEDENSDSEEAPFDERQLTVKNIVAYYRKQNNRSNRLTRENLFFFILAGEISEREFTGDIQDKSDSVFCANWAENALGSYSSNFMERIERDTETFILNHCEEIELIAQDLIDNLTITK